MRILLIEDDVDLAEAVGDALASLGHDVEYAYDGTRGLHVGLSESWDLVLLDLMLGDMDGVEVCRRLRRTSDVPLLMLTARDGLEDKVTGFRAGADDYLVKPFAMEELAVRIEALVRRGSASRTSPALSFGPLVFDPATRTARRGSRPVRLHRAGLAILECLLRSAPAVVSRAQLERVVWGDAAPDGDRLRSHIYLVRRAIDPQGEAPMLVTVHGEGYRLELPGSSGDPD